MQNEQQREATLPRLRRRVSAAAEVKLCLAVATQRAPLMPDLRGQSVRDVGANVRAAGLKLEAHGEGRATASLSRGRIRSKFRPNRAR